MPSLWRTLLVLVSITALIILLWYSPPDEFTELLETEPEPKQTRFPEIYLENTQTQQYAKNGLLNYQLDASKVRYFSAKNNTYRIEAIEYDKPLLKLYTDDGELKWEIRANKGQSDNEATRIELEGDVIVKHHAPGETPTQLATDTLLLLPEQQYAETDKPVIINDAIGVTEATGLKAFFDEQRIEFLQDVKGKYVLP